MKMFRFKFDQNLNKNEEFDFFEAREGGGEEEWDHHFLILTSIITCKHMKFFFLQISSNSDHK